MRYSQNRQQSGEIFRQAMQFMQQQKAAFTPPHLAIWYEYAADLNPPLASILKKKLAANDPLTDEDIWHLHGRHVTGRDVEAFEVCQNKLRGVLDETVSEVDGATREVSTFAQTLASAREQIKEPGQAEILRSLHQKALSFGCFLEGLSRSLTVNKTQTGAILHTLERSQTEPLRDALTGLPNLPGFHRAMDALGLAQGEITGSVMLIADLDNFKVINDTLGHLMGDKALSAVAKVLREAVSPSEIAARLWGEEFAVLIPSHEGSRPAVLAETIRSRVEQLEIKSTLQTRIGRVTVSIGIAVAGAGETRDQLIHRADAAMYASKHNGRNRVTVWSNDLEDKKNEKEGGAGVA